MSRRKNTFSKAIRHLKESPTNSTSGVYSAVPGTTTRTETEVGPTQPDYSTIDWEIDGPNGADTSGLFDGAGNHKLISPPGDNSYILGPMVSMYYTYASPNTWTRIGYLRESDRRMVNLGTITGTIEDWDGETGFQSYGQLTLEQAAWFKHTPKKPDGYRAFYPGPPSSSPDVFGRYYCTITGTPLATHNPTVTTTNAPLDLQPEAIFAAIMDRLGKGKKLSKQEEEWLASNDAQEAAKNAIKQQIENPDKETANLLDKLGKAGETFARYLTGTLPEVIDNKYLGDKYVNSMIKKAEYNGGNIFFGDNILGTAGKPTRQGDTIIIPFNYDFNNNTKEFAQNKGNLNLLQKTLGRVVHAALGPYSMDASPALFGGIPIVGGVMDLILGGQFSKTIEIAKALGGAQHKPGELKIDIKQLEKDNTPLYDQLFAAGLITVDDLNLKRNSKVNKESYLVEKRKLSILNSLKEPVIIPETKQKTYKVRPGRRGKTNFQGMDKLVGDIKPQESFKKPQDIWSDGWQGHNARLSQDKKNIVLEKIGEGKQAWEYMLKYGTKMDAKNLEEFWGKNPDLYSYYSLGGKKYRPIRKEQVRGDYLVFLVDEVGKTSSMLQSELNEKLSEESDMEMITEYNKTNEPIPFLNDPLVRRVAKRLKTQIDYPDRPAVKGYPNEPPPKQIDGWHPELGKRYKYDKLDPVSAIAMRNAPTGDQEIDDNVKKASVKPKVAEANKSDWKEDFYVWPSYLCEGMTTGSLFNMALNPTGSEPVEINDVSLGHHDFSFAPGAEPTPVDPADIAANYEYQIDGTGIGIEGFDGEYLVMSGGSRQGSPGMISTQYFMVLDDFDASKSDSITFTIKAGNNANGGMKPAGPLYAALVNSAHMNSEEHGYGILGLPNPDCHVYDPSLPDFKPLFDGTDTIINYAGNGLPYAGHGIPAHQTGEDVTITVEIPEDWRLPGSQIFFSSEHGHYDSNIQGNYVHHQHLSKQTLPVPGLDGRTVDDLWGFDFTWNLSNYLSNKLYPSDGWQNLDSNGNTELRSMGWFFWHNIQSAKHPNWPIGEDATAYGQYGGYQVGQYYYGNGDPLPISGATQTDHSNNSNPPTDADYEAVAQMILDKFRRSPVYGIKNVQTSRRLPMNVMVGLDDPAASAFIRIGSGPQEGRTSPKKRKKRVETILRSGKEYTDKYIAPDLPGSNATFGDVQASPTGYGEVQGKFADVKDSDIPGKLNTGATPDAVSSGFVDTPKPDSDSWSSAADKAHSQWESQKRAVDSHNEKINKEKDKLFQRADDIWDDIRKQNYEGEDSSGSPYYAKTDKEMTADYMKAGGEDIDAQMAALDKQYKDEPAYPSSDAFDAGGEFASVDSQDPVNTDPNSSDFDFDKYIESLPPEIRKDMESGNPEDDSIFWTLMSLTGGVVGKVGSGIEKLMNMFGRWFNKGKTADETSMPWGDFRQAIGRKDADPSTLWGKAWKVRQTTGKAAGEGAWNPFRWVYTWATDKGGLMSGPDAATREFIRRFPTQMKSIMEQVSKLSFEKNVEYPTQQLSVEEAEKQAMAIFEDENTDQDKAFEVFDKAYKENEGFTRARTETEAIRDSVKTAQDEYNEAASAWSNAFADNKYTGTKGWLNLPDEQRFEKADMSGDYQTYAADKAFVEKWKADAKKGANVYEIGYNYAEKQPAFKQSRKAYDDHEKVLDKLSSDRAAAYEAVTSFLGGLGPHPSPELARKGYLDCDIECMQKKIKLENAAKAASAKEDKGQKKRESLWNSHISTRNNLRDEYVNRNMNQMNLSIKVNDTIRTKIKDMKKVYEEKKKIADELRKTEKERIKAVYDSDWFKKANEELSKSFIIEMERERLNNAWNIDDIANESPSEQDYDNAQGGFDDYLQNYEGLGDLAKMPDYVLESIKRQYSGKDYTIEDKKNILRWQQKIKAGLDDDTMIASGEGGSTGQQNPWVPSSGINVAGGSGRGSNRGKDYDTRTGEVKGITTDSDFGQRIRNAVYGMGNIQAKRKKELGSTIADVSQGLSATDAASIAGSQTTSKGTKKKKKYNTKTVVASFKPQGGTLKETTFERIRKLRKNWDYEGKPTPTETGFPEKEPPERVNGWHPEYGKGHEKRYKKLDPHSAKAMAKVKTGDPKVDNIVKKQTKG